MNLVAILSGSAIHAVLGFLLLQPFGVTPPENPEDPLSRATTPPAQFLAFNFDFSSLDSARFHDWINPARGLVTNGVLLTRAEAEGWFATIFEAADDGDLLEANIRYNYGAFSGGNTFQADAWIEFKVRDEGVERWLRLHYAFVFEIMNNRWYLVQWEYIPADVSLPLGHTSGLTASEDVPEEFSQFVVHYTETSLIGISPWPLLIGDSFASESQLHPLEGTTLGGGVWRLVDAVEAGKPVVLYFFSALSLAVHSVVTPEDFDTQMEFLGGMYETFGFEDLYIFGVTDDPRDELDWLGESGYDDFAPLLDIGSELHMTLNIDAHPYIVVLDSDGTVAAISKTFHPSTLGLIEDRIREVLATAES